MGTAVNQNGDNQNGDKMDLKLRNSDNQMAMGAIGNAFNSKTFIIIRFTTSS